MRLAALVLCAASLSACAGLEQAVDSTARTGAKGVVAEVLATRFPQVPKELITPFTDCIIDNASAADVQEFIKAAVRGVDEGTIEAVRVTLLRPETIACVGGTPGIVG